MVETNMKKTLTILAAAAAIATLSSGAQADNFFVTFLQTANWQIPKCEAPLMLTQITDRKGDIHFACRKPQK
jgi:hypothetical protein